MKFLKYKHIDYKRIATHILFWIVLHISYDFVQTIIYKIEFTSYLLLDIYYVPADLIIVYFTIYFLFPRYLLRKKYLFFSIFFIISLILLTLSIALPSQYFGIKNVFAEQFAKSGKEMPNFYDFCQSNFLMVITVKLMIIGIASVIKLSKIWFKSQKYRQDLEKEKLEIALKLRESELKFLKSQINPHFLFNALNNLYSLTLVKSDKAPDIVLKISALLSYIFHDCNELLISTNKEIDNLMNYIDLQKIRYSEKAKIKINIQKNNENKKIAPLLILPFIENAFKHGLNNNFGKGEINISIKINENNFFFNIYNTCSSDFEIENTENKTETGIKNVRQRL